MWGSTTPNTADECTWTNAPFNNGASSYEQEYFKPHKSEWLDDNDNLKPEYDAASHIMGGDWRIPTEAEFQELLNNTTNKWFTNYKGTGVNGREFTGSNGNSIFIPAAGWCCNGSVNYVGIYGNVWSSSLYTSEPDFAWYLDFRSDSCALDYYYRCCGQSVRGVRK